MRQSTRSRTQALLAMASLLVASIAAGDVRLPRLFRDEMTLQRGQKIPVWGWAEAGERVTVTLGASKRKTRAGKDGRWRVSLPPQGAATDATLIVSGRNTITVKEVANGLNCAIDRPWLSPCPTRPWR